MHLKIADLNGKWKTYDLKYITRITEGKKKVIWTREEIPTTEVKEIAPSKDFTSTNFDTCYYVVVNGEEQKEYKGIGVKDGQYQFLNCIPSKCIHDKINDLTVNENNIEEVEDMENYFYSDLNIKNILTHIEEVKSFYNSAKISYFGSHGAAQRGSFRIEKSKDNLYITSMIETNLDYWEKLEIFEEPNKAITLYIEFLSKYQNDYIKYLEDQQPNQEPIKEEFYIKTDKGECVQVEGFKLENKYNFDLFYHKIALGNYQLTHKPTGVAVGGCISGTVEGLKDNLNKLVSEYGENKIIDMFNHVIENQGYINNKVVPGTAPRAATQVQEVDQDQEKLNRFLKLSDKEKLTIVRTALDETFNSITYSYDSLNTCYSYVGELFRNEYKGVLNGRRGIHKFIDIFDSKLFYELQKHDLIIDNDSYNKIMYDNIYSIVNRMLLKNYFDKPIIQDQE
ncbi:MAG: hypothetical protein ACRDD7_17580 [Peptostreptococcaceae bacterium]